MAVLIILDKKKKNNSGNVFSVKLLNNNELHRIICINNGIFRCATLVTMIESIFFNETNKQKQAIGMKTVIISV